MRFIIATRSKDTADEIRWVCQNVPGMEIHLGSFESLPSFDCVATAGDGRHVHEQVVLLGIDVPV